MLDKKKAAQVNPKGKLSATPKQRTLFDLFPNGRAAPPPPQSDAPQETNDGNKGLPKMGLAAESTGFIQPQTISTVAATKKLREASLEPRPIHPFFVKPKLAARPEKSSVQNDETADNLNDNPKNVIVLRETPELSYEAGSQEDPIILDSPVRPIRPQKQAAQADKPLASLFIVRPSRPLDLRLAAESSKTEHLVTPYPDRLAQHVRGPQNTFHSPSLRFGRRNLSRRPPKQLLGSPNHIYKSNDFHFSAVRQREVSINANQIHPLTTALNEDRRHPAIERLAGGSSSPSSQRLWTDKWHPKAAAEVLGNENSAIYLRDWIRALELHLTTEPNPRSEEAIRAQAKDKVAARAHITGSKRTRVVRAVSKRHGRKRQRIDSDDEDDWIVYSDSAEESDDVEKGLSDEPFRSPARQDRAPSPRSSPFPTSSPRSGLTSQKFETLTNTILLTGPSGIGKTAAVYACAEELGWDVFEVYPGIGKRNASSIDGLIGDAGKNHHVRTTKGGMADSPSKHLHALPKRLEATSDQTGNSQILPERPEFSASPTDTTVSAPAVRQSLILLEEVDIQFKEDTSFWPAVINFIKDCRRPVVITCNDISLIPTEDLPLQTILHFQPCPSPLATSYLLALCSAEGYSLERDTILEVYQDLSLKLEALDVPDDSVPPMSRDFPTPDLRRTINHLQFFCSSTRIGSGYTSGWEDMSDLVEDFLDWDRIIEEQELRKSPDGVSADQNLFTTPMRAQTPPRHLLAARHAELISFVDSQLMRSVWDTEQAATWGNCEPSNDDEVGHPILFLPKSSETVFSGSPTQDGEIVSGLMWLSRAGLTAGATREPMSIEIPFRARELFRARVDHRLQMKQALGGVVPLPVLMMRHTTARLDYATRVRDIMETEDEQEEAHAQRGKYTGRRTRNSSRMGFERVYTFMPETRTALAGIIL